MPFHLVSMHLLSLFRRERHLSRHKVLRVLHHAHEGRSLRRYLGFDRVFPFDSGLRYFERQITPALQQEINALQIEVLYQAWFLPSRPHAQRKVPLSAETKVTKGAGSRKAGLAMAFKLLLAAEQRWRRINAPHLVALARAGVKFPNGQAEMFPLEPSDDSLFARAPSVYAAEEIPIHNI